MFSPLDQFENVITGWGFFHTTNYILGWSFLFFSWFAFTSH